jgi:hypothetical protein
MHFLGLHPMILTAHIGPEKLEILNDTTERKYPTPYNSTKVCNIFIISNRSNLDWTTISFGVLHSQSGILIPYKQSKHKPNT